jgi:dTDP-4-amino-4,6-dideoxygalactose transaminase
MKAIVAIARRHGIAVIEDCTHAMEASIDGHHVGTWGDFGCFSFEAGENFMGAEGGVLIAREVDAVERIRDGSDQDLPGTEPAFKQGMSGGAARAGLRQIERSEALWQRRGQIWERYQRAFAGPACARPAPPAPGTRHAYSGYVLQIDIERLGRSRDEIVEELTLHNLDIDAAAHHLALHTLADSALSLKGKEGDCSTPNSLASARSLSPFGRDGRRGRGRRDPRRAPRAVLLASAASKYLRSAWVAAKGTEARRGASTCPAPCRVGCRTMP